MYLCVFVCMHVRVVIYFNISYYVSSNFKTINPRLKIKRGMLSLLHLSITFAINLTQCINVL